MKNYDIPELHEIGCIGKITSFKETEDKRYLIELKRNNKISNITRNKFR